MPIQDFAQVFLNVWQMQMLLMNDSGGELFAQPQFHGGGATTSATCGTTSPRA